MRAARRGVSRALAGIRIGATSLLLTMRVFGTEPRGRPRPNYAIEREVNEPSGPFDPREVVAGRVILTLPLADARPGRLPAPAAFHRN